MISNLYPISFPHPLEGKQLFDLLSEAAAQTFRDEKDRLSLITTENDAVKDEFKSHLSIIFDEQLFINDPRWKTICIRVGGPPLQSGVIYTSIDLFIFHMRRGWGLWKSVNLHGGNSYFRALTNQRLGGVKKRVGMLASENA